ncbi:MAG: hypothetical protein R2793_08655 [Flavobacteriaceae bacterium]
MWQYTKAVAHSKSRTEPLKTQEECGKIAAVKAILKIEKAESYNNDYFKEKVLENLRLNESLMKSEYDKIIDMKEVAEKSYDAMSWRFGQSR